MRARKLALAMAIAASPATALELFPRAVWPVTQPVSLAYDPELCALWVAQERPEIVLMTPGGREIRRFDSGFSRVRALTVDGDTLIAGDGWGLFQRYDRNGTAIGATFRIVPDMADVEGLHRDPDGNIFLVQDDPARVVQVDADGHEVFRLVGETLDPPMTEPQGIARDPVTGHLLVIDDNEGLNALFELSAQGEVLSVTPLSEWGRDAEAVALQPHTGQLFVGFDMSHRVAVFDWVPTRTGQADPMDLGPPCPMS